MDQNPGPAAILLKMGGQNRMVRPINSIATSTSSQSENCMGTREVDSIQTGLKLLFYVFQLIPDVLSSTVIIYIDFSIKAA